MVPRFLSEQQLHDFNRDGFLLVRRPFDSTRVDQIVSWVNDVQNYPEAPGKYMMYYEKSLLDPDKKLLHRMENLYDFHDGFHELFDSDPVLGAVSDLFGEPAVLFKDKINFKFPGGIPFDWHQDHQAGWWEYSELFITALVCIDKVTKDNGPLELAAGFHKKGLIGDKWTPMTDQQIEGMKFEPYMLGPGDMVFFDSFIPHGSGPNLSDKSRRILFITYGRLSEGDHRKQYYADKRKSFPPDCERDPNKEYHYRV